MNYIGIDIGTSGCKAVVFDQNGQSLALAKQSYEVLFTGEGGAELDSDDVIRKCFQVIKSCTSQVEPDSVQALCISSQGEAFTALNANEESLCHAMVSSDTRSEPFVRRFLQEFDEKRLYCITGHTAHPLFTLFKLMWLRECKPEVWSKARYFLCFEDLLQLRLGLKPTISWPLAGRTMMFDVSEHKWSPGILRTVGITAHHLARPVPSGTVVGEISSAVAKQLGLPAHVRVVSGGHDQTCSALGAGVTDEGTAMLATGTVECITAAFRKPIFNDTLKENNLCTYDYTIPETFTTSAYHLTGGNILKWFKDEFGAVETKEARRRGNDPYDILLRKMACTSTKLLVLPYFTSSGTPYFDTQTKGAIFGLRLSTKREELLRALLEGVAFEMRLNLEILKRSGYKIDELRAVGGGAQSRAWIQLKANIMDTKITTLDITEAGCYGAAMLACSALNDQPIRDVAAKWVRPRNSVYPDHDTRAWYTDRFDLYKKLYPSVSALSL